MRKEPIVIYIMLVLCACSSSPAKTASTAPGKAVPHLNHWVTLPEPGHLTIIGISARQSTRESEIAIAQEDAAKKISMFHGVTVAAEAVHSIGAGFLDYYVDSNADLDYDRDLEKYIEKLSYDPERDIMSNDGVIYVRFTYPAVFPGAINYSPGKKRPDGSPEWTTRPPSNMGDFFVGVGHSGKRQRLRDGILNSYEYAAAAVAAQISTSVESSHVIDSATYRNDTLITRKSAGELRYFTVIEIWINPDNGEVWTLAVAKNAE